MVEYDESSTDMIIVFINEHVAGYFMPFTDGYRFDPTGAQSLQSNYMRQLADKLDELNKV